MLLQVKKDIVSSQKRRNELLEEQNELTLFSIVPKAGDAIAEQYLMLKKQLALDRLMSMNK